MNHRVTVLKEESVKNGDCDLNAPVNHSPFKKCLVSAGLTRTVTVYKKPVVVS